MKKIVIYIFVLAALSFLGIQAPIHAKRVHVIIEDVDKPLIAFLWEYINIHPGGEGCWCFNNYGYVEPEDLIQNGSLISLNSKDDVFMYNPSPPKNQDHRRNL